MKFQCERCKTRYSIADEKVRGKILKIRCKSCENIITVRDGVPARQAPEPAPAVRPRPLASTVEIAAMSGSRLAVESLPPQAPALEWYLSTGGSQEGPFSGEQARVAGKASEAEMFAWRDDFSEWLPVEQVPVLARHLPKPALPPPPPSGAAKKVTAVSGMTPLPLPPAGSSTPVASAPPPVADD